MAILKLSDQVKPFLGDSPFETIAKLEGLTVRDKEGRRTFKTRLGDKNYFVKYHRGIGWKEISKELSQLRLPIVSAHNEYRAIKTLQQLGIQTTNPVGVGERGRNPAQIESFLITDAIEDAITLEQLTTSWPTQKPSFHFKRKLIQEVARIARVMHGHGINHRDFYLCHFKINQSTAEKQDSHNIKLYLMDLHRAQIRTKVPTRWLVKDLGALLFSSANIGLTRQDILYFIGQYSGRSPNQELRENTTFWNAIHQRADKFYRRDWKRPMPKVLFSHKI